ncbi:MAG: anti-sigma factor family protein [Bryobacteraceae bacterium]
MHEPVVEGLEEYLAGEGPGTRMTALEQHLAGCAACRETVEALRAQQQLLRELRSPRGAAPAPGFYARVMERIESQRARSIWSIFLEPAFSRRLSYASLGLLVALGAAVWSGGGEAVVDDGNPMVVIATELPEAPGVDPGHDRAVVLTHLVSMNGGGDDLLGLPVSSD